MSVKRFIGIIKITVGMFALVVGLPAGTVSAASPLVDCDSCHLSKVPIVGVSRPELLKGHDRLGTGNEACMVCHDRDQKHSGMLSLVTGDRHLKMLNIIDQALIPAKDSFLLCGQCHEERYKAWEDGTHGVPAWNVGKVGFPGGVQKTCVDCHDPHQPQIALNITKPHPTPAPSPEGLPETPFRIAGIALLAVVGIGTAVIVAGKGG